MPDPRYGSVEVTKFVNNIMLDGKKSVAYKVFYSAMDIIKSKNESDELNELQIWKKALENVTPHVEVASRKVGGSTFQIPRQVRLSRRTALAMRWLIGYSRNKKGRAMGQRLADEILSAYKEEGLAFKKKEDTHKMAEANKAFSHIRF